MGDGKTSNASAIGAQVTIEAGGKTYRARRGRRPRLPEPERVAGHVGLGTAETIDKVTVRWPGKDAGAPQVWTNLKANTAYTLRQGKAEAEPAAEVSRGPFLFHRVDHVEPGHLPDSSHRPPVIASRSPAGSSLVAFFLIAGAAIGTVVATCGPAAAVKPDPIAAAHANARGIGHMEQFKYPDAVKEFEEAAKLAPDWTPAKINLGIALLNTQAPENLDRALKLFAEILASDRDNAHAHYCTGIILYYQQQASRGRQALRRGQPHRPERRPRVVLTAARASPTASESEEALKFYQKALKLNPYLNAARYGIAQHRHHVGRREAQEATARRLRDATDRPTPRTCSDIKYTEMGRYARGDRQVARSRARPSASCRCSIR